MREENKNQKSEDKIVSSIEYIVKRESVERIAYIVKMVSQFTGYPVEELKSGWLIVLTNSHLVTKKLYLKLTNRTNWPTGKQGNWVTN